MLEIRDICTAYLEGYIHAKGTEFLIYGKVQEVDLDRVKECAVKCMEEYIEHSSFSVEEKEEMKANRKQWADLVLKGVKQRLHESGKISDIS